MAQITWRNVDSPDFRGSADGARIAALSLDRAFGALGDSLDKFDATRRTDASNAALNNAMNYSSPEALRAAIASGEVFNGVNRGLVNPAAFAALDARTGTLLNQDVTAQSLDFNRQMNPIRISDAQSANRVALGTEAARIAAPGLQNQVTQNQIRSGSLANDFTAATQQDRIANTNSGNQFGVYNNNRTMQTNSDSDLGRNIASDFIRGSGNQQEALAALEQHGDVSPAVREQARRYILAQPEGAYGANAAFAPVTPGGSAPGTAGTQRGGQYDATHRYTPTGDRPAVTEMTLGQVQDFQRGTLRPATGHSPVGAYQINHDTLAEYGPKVFGENWRNVQMTPDNQDRLGQAIFEARKRGDLTDTWAALPRRAPGAYANMTWEQIAPMIRNREVSQHNGAQPGQPGAEPGPTSRTPGVIPNEAEITQFNRQAAALSAAASQEANQRLNQTQNNGITSDYNTTEADYRSSVNDVAVRMRKEGGIFAEVPIDRLTRAIDDVMKRAQSQGQRISAATAAAIVERGAYDVNRPGWISLPEMFGGLGGRPGLTSNNDFIDQEIKQVANRGRMEDSQSAGAIQAAIAANDTAKKNLDEAGTRLVAAQRRAQALGPSSPTAQENLARAHDAYQRAQAEVARTVGAIRNNPEQFGAQFPGMTNGRPNAGNRDAQGNTVARTDEGPRTPPPTSNNRNTNALATAAQSNDPVERAAQTANAAEAALQAHEARRPALGLAQRRANPNWQAEEADWRMQQAKLQAQLQEANKAYQALLPAGADRAFR